jgi:hypothetical protein
MQARYGTALQIHSLWNRWFRRQRLHAHAPRSYTCPFLGVLSELTRRYLGGSPSCLGSCDSHGLRFSPRNIPDPDLTLLRLPVPPEGQKGRAMEVPGGRSQQPSRRAGGAEQHDQTHRASVVPFDSAEFAGAGYLTFSTHRHNATHPTRPLRSRHLRRAGGSAWNPDFISAP